MQPHPSFAVGQKALGVHESAERPGLGHSVSTASHVPLSLLRAETEREQSSPAIGFDIAEVNSALQAAAPPALKQNFGSVHSLMAST